MIDLNQIKKIYFIGIGGIGMSALARYFNFKNVAVFGYDKTETVLTKQLEKEGIKIHYKEDLNLIEKDADLIVYTPAIPTEHIEYQYFINNNYTVLKRADCLQLISENYKTIAIAGTHGKTTITSMASHIAKEAGLKPTAFIGGLCTNFNGNFIIDDGDILFVEADEFDKSFLKLNPHISLVSSVDGDHFDIYKDYEELKATFKNFVANTKNEQNIILKRNLKLKEKEVQLNYAFDDNNAFAYSKNLKTTAANCSFDLVINDKIIENVVLQMQGIHNVENAVAASLINYQLGVSLANIKNALQSFLGIKRRFEYIHNSDDFVLIDDYAHHPKEVEALLTSVKNIYPNKKVSVIFQPHLFSRTKDFYKEFAESLSIADEIIVTEIYPARELPMEGVNSEMIINEILEKDAKVVNKKDLLAHLKNKKIEVLVIAGAGDINNYLESIKSGILN